MSRLRLHTDVGSSENVAQVGNLRYVFIVSGRCDNNMNNSSEFIGSEPSEPQAQSSRWTHKHKLGWVLGLIGAVGLISLVLPTGRAGPDRISNSKAQAVAENRKADGPLLNVQQTKATYRYDDLNRLVEIINEDGTRITYTYDAAGNLMQTVTRPR